MKLNHINLTVTDVSEAQHFLETYFGLPRMQGGNINMSGAKGSEVTYPKGFHIGFITGERAAGQ